jgi:hypothetical protein
MDSYEEEKKEFISSLKEEGLDFEESSVENFLKIKHILTKTHSQLEKRNLVELTTRFLLFGLAFFNSDQKEDQSETDDLVKQMILLGEDVVDCLNSAKEACKNDKK